MKIIKKNLSVCMCFIFIWMCNCDIFSAQIQKCEQHFLRFMCYLISSFFLSLLTRCPFCLQQTIKPSVNLHIKYSPSNQINPHTHTHTQMVRSIPSHIRLSASLPAYLSTTVIFITIQNGSEMWHIGLALQHRVL
jgi:hypothetical protein